MFEYLANKSDMKSESTLDLSLNIPVYLYYPLNKRFERKCVAAIKRHQFLD